MGVESRRMLEQPAGAPVEPRTIVFGVTVAMTAKAFLVAQLKAFADNGWQVHLVTGEPGLEDFAAKEGARLHVVPMRRTPSAGDPRALLEMLRLLRRLRPDLVVMGTPKMGLVGTLAARLARVPARVYLVHGYRPDGATGLAHRILRRMERTAAGSATDVIAVSPSLAARLVEAGVISAGEVRVLGSGSANGVDLDRFHPVDLVARDAIRRGLGLSVDDEVVLVAGRLTHDKGLAELPAIWERIRAARPKARLLLVGGEEPADDRDEAALRDLRKDSSVAFIGFTDEIERFYGAADVLLLTTRREGLGMVALEAGAAAVPAVAWRATGVIDAVVDGKTGVLVPIGDVNATSTTVLNLLEDENMRLALGAAATAHVAREFDHRRVVGNWLGLASELVAANSKERDA
jgi:glycosyltransferase involved in cell wall biosynthesis